MKRMFAIALICLFGFAFGCGGSKAEGPAPETADEAAAGGEEAAPADATGAEATGAEGAAPADEAAPADDMGGGGAEEAAPME